jgi:hypothetical protein
MPNSVAQRIGPLTRKILTRETTRGADPGSPTGVVLALRDLDGVAATRPEVDASYYNGTAIGLATAPGPINAGGRTPLWLDFTTIGNILQMPIGTSAYSRVGLVTGSLHNFPLPAGVFTPLSGQLQDEYLEGTPAFERLRYQLVKAIALSYANGGAAPFDVDWVGSGDSVFTDIGGTKTDNGSSNPASVYNGFARMAVAALAPTWFPLAGIKNFNLTYDTGATAEPVGFNDGVSGSVNPSMFSVKGGLELMTANGGTGFEADFTFLNNAINRNLMYYDCEYADASATGPVTFPSKWLRIVAAGLRFERRSASSSGRAGITTNQSFWLVNDFTLSKIAAESFGTVVGPYNISAGVNDIVSHNIDAIGASSVTLTPGATRSALQICNDLNGNGTFAARALADVFNGRVRITSKQTAGSGSTSSVALTAAANNANATLGFNTTVITGFTTPFLFQLYNLLNTNYPQ